MTSTSSVLADLARELTAMLALLEQEATALAAGQADALTPLIAQRETANRHLSGLWLSLADSLGLPANASLDTLRERGAGVAPERWREMEDLARHAERLNRLNGRIIDEQLRRTQTAVQVLQGAAGNRMLYGADGRMSEFLNPNRSIDTA